MRASARGALADETSQRLVGAIPNEILSSRANMRKENRQPVLGLPPKGVEAEPDIEWRKKFLREIGYKL